VVVRLLSEFFSEGCCQRASVRVAAVRGLLPEGFCQSGCCQGAAVRVSVIVSAVRELQSEGLCQSSCSQRAAVRVAAVGAAAVGVAALYVFICKLKIRLRVIQSFPRSKPSISTRLGVISTHSVGEIRNDPHLGSADLRQG